MTRVLTTHHKLRFALSSVTSWRSVDGDFDYVPFWQTIVDFFEKAPGRVAQKKVDRLLAWWTRCIVYLFNGPRLTSIYRKIFGISQRAELTDAAKARMSVQSLQRQRAQEDDAFFDSD